jgi:hypothetical protein
VKALVVVAGVLLLAGCSSRPFTHNASSQDVTYAQQLVGEKTLWDELSQSSFCALVSAFTCERLYADTDFQPATYESLTHSDGLILQSLLSIDSVDVREAGESDVDQARLNVVRGSGMSLGVKLGRSVEMSRIQEVVIDFEDVYDGLFRFDALMIDTSEGRIIVPPIIDRSDHTTRISDDGRYIRIVDILYRIRENARFSIRIPNWRNYLLIPVEKPNYNDIVSTVLPENDQELDVWRAAIVEGYLTGIEIARAESKRARDRLVADLKGMQRYHLLRAHNMVSAPVIESNIYAATGSVDGRSLGMDDANLAIAITPQLVSQADRHRAVPRLRNFERFGLDESLLPVMDWRGK